MGLACAPASPRFALGAAAPADLPVRELGVTAVEASSSCGGREDDSRVPSLQRLAEPGVTPDDFIGCAEDNAPVPRGNASKLSFVDDGGWPRAAAPGISRWLQFDAPAEMDAR